MSGGWNDDVFGSGSSPYEQWRRRERFSSFFSFSFFRRWWKIFVILLILFFFVPVLFRMNTLRNDFKHFQSRFVGIQRKVVLYAQNGEMIHEWTTDSFIEDRGGTIYFIAEGKAVIISGTFVVEELGKR